MVGTILERERPRALRAVGDELPANAGDGYTRWYLGASHGAIAGLPERAPLARRGPTQLLALQRHLHGAASIPALFGRASDVALTECGFDRAVVLSVEDHLLTAGLLPPLDDPGSEALRLQLLEDPVRLVRGSVEAEFIRLAEGGRGELIDGCSVLKATHGLEQLAIGAVVVDTRVLAFVVADRAAPAVGFQERAVVQAFAQLVACSLERLVLRQRITHIAAELRYMTDSTAAVLRKAIDTDVALPTGPSELAPDLRTMGDVPELFTRRELTVIKLLMVGGSNREIAEALHISPETVKKYMSRVMRKVGASNRAEAAVRCMEMFAAAPQ
jgi:DNA-binding NarL/FixJ family response regulator